MNICVVGTGYVGLVTGAVFADLGNDIVCVDKDRDKIEALRTGRMPIYEPGLEEMVARNVDDRRLSFTTDMARASATPTPSSSPWAPRPRRRAIPASPSSR